MSSFTATFQGFCLVFKNIYLKEHFSLTSSYVNVKVDFQFSCSGRVNTRQSKKLFSSSIYFNYSVNSLVTGQSFAHSVRSLAWPLHMKWKTAFILLKYFSKSRGRSKTVTLCKMDLFVIIVSYYHNVLDPSWMLQQSQNCLFISSKWNIHNTLK